MGRDSGATAVAEPPAKAAAKAPAKAPTPAPAASRAVAAPAASSTTFGVRRPLVGTSGSVAGFELALPPAVEQRLLARGDMAARAAHQAMLLASASNVVKARRAPVLTIAATALAKPSVAQLAQGGEWLCVEDLVQLPPEIAQGLRGRGVRLGVPDGPPAQAPQADFVLLRAASGGLDTLMLSSQHWRSARPRVPLVASGLQHLDDVERLLRSGFTLVGGALDRSRSAPVQRPLSAAAHRICELLNHLSLDAATSVVAESVRGDVALSYRLLRYANSPAVGLRRAVESVDDAVMLLGRQELYRWLSVLLLTVAESRQASQALQEAALARGRLLESLARRVDDPSPSTLFTIGMLSLLEVLLQTPLPEALAPLRLSETVRAALLSRQGPYAPYLVLAQALDADDASGLDALAQPWGGLEVVQTLAEEAWSWAHEVSGSAGSDV